MASKTIILKSIYNQIDTITNILYKIYEEKTMSDQGFSMLKKVHKRLYNFVRTQEIKIQRKKAGKPIK